jgi:hypothetical protein
MRAEWKKTVSGTISYTKKVGNVNVDQHWDIRKRCRLVVCTCNNKAVRFDHIKELMTAAPRTAMNPFKLYGTTTE